MRNGVCPKCQSSEVYQAFSKSTLETGLKADDGQLLLHIHRDKGWLGDYIFLYLEQFVCQTCGYLEFYVQDRNELGKLAGSLNWKRVK